MTADQRPSGHFLASIAPPGQYQFSGQMVGRFDRGEQNHPGEALQGVGIIIVFGGGVFIRLGVCVFVIELLLYTLLFLMWFFIPDVVSA